MAPSAGFRGTAVARPMGGARVVGAAGSAGRVFVGTFPSGFNTRPGVRFMTPGSARFHGNFGNPFFPFGVPFNGFNNTAFFRAGFFFGHNPRFNRFPFFGTGFSPFVNSWGWGWGGWPYAVDYSAWNYDQAQSQYQQSQDAVNAQLQGEIQEDQLRQMELERQLADQRAADAASRTVQTVPKSTSPPTERELPPTVLVYRDHRQVEVRNYAIAGNTIFDFGPHWTRKIAIADLDIPATVAANEERGVEFRLPNSPVKIKHQEVLP